ncbi:MAG: sodium-translocating pyrophosphatase [Planctomycetota bacterium]|nr:MAG: sodium-translocating pyrophosphatase [Planctomycetota bacterium]
MAKAQNWTRFIVPATLAALAVAPVAFASEADLQLPPIDDKIVFSVFGKPIMGATLMYAGLVVSLVGALFGVIQYIQVDALPVHPSMRNVSNIIWETCKSYLAQQGKFLALLWFLIAGAMIVYFGFLNPIGGGHGAEGAAPQTSHAMAVGIVLLCSILGILGSYSVAWFGIRINTRANSRTAFASLRGDALKTLAIPLQSGMSIGMLLVSVELFFMIGIMMFIPSELVGASFIGFAIGESLGATVLRICGGIFTKIADIGSDLMKIVFKLPEDDPKNPGVIADCTGDNAGDSVGPTADGFETYGVTGVALIAFLAYALGGGSADQKTMCMQLIVWLFSMRALMIVCSLVSYYITEAWSKASFSGKKEFDEEAPLTRLVIVTSIISIVATFFASHALLGTLAYTGSELKDLWWILASIISLGTAAGALIPEFTKVFTSTGSKHVNEVTNASAQGGASLNILSGFVAGNFSAFWTGLLILVLMAAGWKLSGNDDLTRLMPDAYRDFAAPIFAFGLIAFGFLGMGPVTIAVDSFGPVTDNAQSVFELSRIEAVPNIKEELKRDYGIHADFEHAKHLLEKGDGAGNTFKATAKPVLIGTAVVGATTMIFGIILALSKNKMIVPEGKNIESILSIVRPEILLGLLMGGAVVYWFTGASTQAVVTGAYSAVVFIKKNINLDKAEASIQDSKEVVKICTIYAQRGMWYIFLAVFCLSLGLPFFSPVFFIGYLIGIAFFGLFQAIFMANAGGAWDNAKKIVEVDMRAKGTELHAATVVGDTVGDPFKDTSSVSLNPVIKFTTLFGLLSVEIVLTIQNEALKMWIGLALFTAALYFIWASFYKMRIPVDQAD